MRTSERSQLKPLLHHTLTPEAKKKDKTQKNLLPQDLLSRLQKFADALVAKWLTGTNENGNTIITEDRILK